MDQAANLRNVVKLHSQRRLEHARVITVTSGKGGVGKSNMAVNLAACFSRSGKRVIVFDADFGLANVEVMLGTVPKYTLQDVLYGNMQVRDIVTNSKNGISFVSGGSGITKLNNLNQAQIRRACQSLSQLEDLCDILIIDTGAGVSDAVLDFVMASPEVVVVTTPEPSSLTDSYALIKTLYNNPRFAEEDTRLYLLANKVNSEIEGRAVYDKLSQVVGKFLGGRLELLGMIPSDAVLEKCTRSQRVLSFEAPTAKSAKAIAGVSDRLLSDAPGREQEKGITRFFNSFLRKRV